MCFSWQQVNFVIQMDIKTLYEKAFPRRRRILRQKSLYQILIPTEQRCFFTMIAFLSEQ